jgi:hypothetical protein
VGITDLVGPDKYVKALNTVAHEQYPATYEQGQIITVGSIGGDSNRNVTYVQ